MLQTFVGCSGWNYDAWGGHFYPKGTPVDGYLPYYSKVFDFVEIDNSFYRIPSLHMVRKWATNTPANFKFTAKMSQIVTHEKRLGTGADAGLRHFYDAFMPLKDKLFAILVQLPASITKKEGFKKLKMLRLETRFRHAIEVRHESWFDDEVYDFFKNNSVCVVATRRIINTANSDY